jgi:hypothetical protein
VRHSIGCCDDTPMAQPVSLHAGCLSPFGQSGGGEGSRQVLLACPCECECWDGTMHYIRVTLIRRQLSAGCTATAWEYGRDTVCVRCGRRVFLRVPQQVVICGFG